MTAFRCDCICHRTEHEPADADWEVQLHGCHTVLRCDRCWQTFKSSQTPWCLDCAREFPSIDALVTKETRL